MCITYAHINKTLAVLLFLAAVGILFFTTVDTRETIERSKKEIRERERSERARYSKVYGIDVRDPSVFDLVVDSSSKTPDAVVAIIAERVAKWAT